MEHMCQLVELIYHQTLQEKHLHQDYLEHLHRHMDTDTGMHNNQHNNHLHNQHNNQHNNQHSNQQFKTLHNNNHKQSKDIKEVENKETKNS
ncbi:protein of unknown function, DUF4106 family [Trichomonas vaginalis G3]|uniref:protein of unknown function, DUF4106 family n=2 Tax=Trichomonas vaginalis (strain ATCC PRA-98 / G3) TaxID=412133 RepID=UPI0021E554DB|nr:protein of unknown function, DUF4106 family [Trichomonas vaginalis G3]XP_051088728.1 protein of unknown function, DUF4106 family [Trichomonas vaginalis G3]XP_051091939.1 protein of unknown function, DUF4106 family [Trichomonas vaginalis G3]XP_051095863.1 protein of unknown function, DUF4106 family [Trichomonas vaginalis G3]XP_051098563.1 protein of unknown function, DUF4106 family [Trichomonas vaginalis G3]XP_051104714.1 protein of unknown function, DUF4106 family [Trichomonas vaginalis G3]